MKRITSNYESELKEDLFAEIEARKSSCSPNFETINSGSLKPDLVAALQLDDEHQAAPETEDVSGLPEVDEAAPVANEVETERPHVSEFKGRYKCKRDSLIYALAVAESDPRGKNYHARNQRFAWQGTQREFEDQFVKV